MGAMVRLHEARLGGVAEPEAHVAQGDRLAVAQHGVDGGAHLGVGDPAHGVEEVALRPVLADAQQPPRGGVQR